MIYMINPTIERFYWLMVHQDLLGSWCLRKISGRLDHKQQRQYLAYYPNELAALQAMSEAEYTKRQRGYIYADSCNVDYFDLRPQTIAEVLAS